MKSTEKPKLKYSNIDSNITCTLTWIIENLNRYIVCENMKIMVTNNNNTTGTTVLF